VNAVTELSGQICQICGDEIEITVDGELFVACNECAFPVCRPCYEYERREGNQACPQCKTRYKRLKGEASINFYFHLSVNIDFSNNGNKHQVVLELRVMRKKRTLMIWKMSLTLEAISDMVTLRPCSLLTTALAMVHK